MNRKQRRATAKQAKPTGVVASSAAAASEASLLAQAAWHQQHGKLDDAVTLYKRALSIQPANSEALNNLACVLLAQGKRADASDKFAQALTLSPELFDSYADIMAILAQVNPAVAQGIARAMQAWPATISLGEMFGDGELGSGELGNKELGSTEFSAIAGDPLLRSMLEGNAVRDVGLERFLTAVRRAILERVSDTAAPDSDHNDLPRFCCALARQCFINEYVFVATPEELQQAERLADGLRTVLASGEPIPPLWLPIVASYFPLHSLPMAEALLERQWPAVLDDLLTQQIREPSQERRMRDSIPRLTAIDDDLSSRVRQQYEENPYPRWVFAPSRPTPMTIDAYLRREFPAAPFRPLGERNVSILIAGCGAGLHSVGMAQRFKNSRLTAVDLSLASLCYARRKTDELGIDTIDYAQADLLQLDRAGAGFDVIDASGVLHHLADPMAGWRALLALVRPGGLMRIGLYSEIARRDVVAARAFIADGGYSSTADDIRRCRQDLMASSLQGIARYYDFFATSECRDLLFHVQEHRLTIPAIDSFLKQNELAFIGFELSPSVRRHYGMLHPADPAMTNLGHWDAYEQGNPSVFASMYQFWVQKL